MKAKDVFPNLKLIPIPPLFAIIFPTPQATESEFTSLKKSIKNFLIKKTFYKINSFIMRKDHQMHCV